MPHSYSFKGRIFNALSLAFLTLLLLSACSGQKQSLTEDQARVDLALLQTLPEQDISYEKEVRPVLQSRCVVCHGCYDAPCQLKLSSPAGITRGANPEKVYNAGRFSAIEPTRLYIDAKTTEEWRNKGFHSVLNEGSDDPVTNLEQSAMYKMLRLKQMNPQSRVGMLSDTFDLSLGRKETCPVPEDFDKYARKFPDQGMPFAMPNLDNDEYSVLVQWLAQGAPVPADPQPSNIAASQIERWETFLNASDKKQQLVSRYIYEHLFIGHLRLEGTDEREFYRLVRSSTPPGQLVNEIPTVRPYDDPGMIFYYRLQRYPGDIVAKTHFVYELSDARLARYRELFIAPNYEVNELPSYEPLIASNPFKAFQTIPPRSRYEFLLDDARYFIEGFMKGPVCRGMVALNVIEDRFWVAFLDPDFDSMLDTPAFLAEMADDLQLPSAQGGKIKLTAWKDYKERVNKYSAGRFQQYTQLEPLDINVAMKTIWDGNGNNPNAALTIFRHFDSASVTHGLVGDYPETMWIMDYPLFERIHYLLVAGYNVFDNLSHQLNTRLYMDFLRMEGEDMYLSFLPTTHRKTIRDDWYQGMRKDLEDIFDNEEEWMNTDVFTGYQSTDPQKELYQHIERRLAPILERKNDLSRCQQPPCDTRHADSDKRRADAAMRGIADIRGEVLRAFPDIAFVRVRRSEPGGDDLAYSIIRDKAYKNVTSMFQNEDDTRSRDYSEDSLTVVDWLEGAYPNFFFEVDIDDIEHFTKGYAALTNREDYERFISIYGIRRTDTKFWEVADWTQDQYLREQPVKAGLFDLNRYRNL